MSNLTQNQKAIQLLHKWIEKVAANANTAELDALELSQLQRLLQTIMGTYQTPYREILLNRDIVIKDDVFGTVRLLVPVSSVEGQLVINQITPDISNENKIRFLISFLPDPTVTSFTYGDALTLFNSIRTSLVPLSILNTIEEAEIIDYLNSISTVPVYEVCTFCLDVDLKTNESKFEIKFTTYPSIILPLLTNPTVTELTATTATVGGRYDYTGRRTITEVGAVLSQTGEDDVVFPADSVATPFTVNITGLVDDIVYVLRTYIKFSDGEIFSSNPVNLEGKDLPNVTTGEASTITTTTATVAGSYIYDVEEGVGEITEVGVEYKTGEGGFTSKAAVAVATSFTVDLDTLTLGSTYSYRIYVKIGETEYYGEVLTFDTLSE